MFWWIAGSSSVPGRSHAHGCTVFKEFYLIIVSGRGRISAVKSGKSTFKKKRPSSSSMDVFQTDSNSSL
jgi:hypothetical protein